MYLYLCSNIKLHLMQNASEPGLSGLFKMIVGILTTCHTQYT